MGDIQQEVAMPDHNSHLIPHSRPTLGVAEAEAARDAVLSGQVSAGPRTAELESALAERVGVGGALAASSGTAALYTVLKALGVGAGDEVLVPSFVCTALLHSVWAAGAQPVVCDICDVGDIDDNFNLSPESAAGRLTDRTAAIIVPHMFGAPASVTAVSELGPPVIEDCAQALGASIDGRPCGSFGAASVFSFYATKMIASGEGGAVASNTPGLLDTARDLIEYDKKTDATPRFNLKFNDIAAGVALVQLARLDEFIARRRAIAAIYSRELANVTQIKLPTAADPVYYRYVVRTDDPAALIAKLRERGIVAEPPVDPALHRIVESGECPNADRAWAEAVSLPIYPSLTDDEAARVVAAIKE
jgi:perosamine synthetase